MSIIYLSPWKHVVAHWKYLSGVLPMSINNVMEKYQEKYPVSLILRKNNYLTNFYETGKNMLVLLSSSEAKVYSSKKI